jgi:hypothetical protein
MVPVFPDVEALTLNHLRGILPEGIRYGTEVPGDYDGAQPFVMVRRIGGFIKWPALDMATLDVEVWASTRDVGHDLAQLVTSHLMHTRGTGGVPFARVSTISGLVFMVDDLTELSRWVMTFQISVRPMKGADNGA